MVDQSDGEAGTKGSSQGSTSKVILASSGPLLVMDLDFLRLNTKVVNEILNISNFGFLQ